MMSEQEYRYMQDRFRRLLRPRPGYGGSYRTDEIYNEGVLACKSVLHEIFERERKLKESQARLEARKGYEQQ